MARRLLNFLTALSLLLCAAVLAMGLIARWSTIGFGYGHEGPDVDEITVVFSRSGVWIGRLRGSFGP